MVLLRRATAVRVFVLGFWLSWLVLAVSAAAAGGPRDTDTPAARIAFLRAEIARHDELYFRHAQPEISDYHYDQLKRELIALEQTFPELAATIDKPLAPLGDDRNSSFDKRRHLAPMLSLEKAYAAEDLVRFVQRITRALPDSALDFVVEPKFDGLAVSATYVDGKLAHVVTRGDGGEGDDVTANARKFCELPSTLRTNGTPVPALVELRGEVFITRAEFARINEEQTGLGEKPYANPRNLAAGTLKSLDEDASGERKLSIVFFGIGEMKTTAARAPVTQLDVLREIETWGLPIPEHVQTVPKPSELWSLIQRLGRERTDWPFPTDGVVVKVNALAAQEALGASAEAPRWAIAFKFAPERVRTRVTGITLQVGRTGLITPVAEFEPVALGGATVARATLHNADEIARLDLRVADRIWVERAGEVVPAVVEVDRSERAADSVGFIFPTQCPACDAKLAREEGKTAWRCPSATCPAQLKRRLLHYASADAAAIQGLGAVTIERLVDGGKVRGIADLYRLTSDELAEVEGVGENSAVRLIGAIDASKRRELWRIVHGLGIPGVGLSAAKTIAPHIDDVSSLIALADASQGGEGAAESSPRIRAALAAHLSRTGAKEELEKLAKLEVGVVPAENGRSLHGMTFVLTGTLPTLSRREAVARIEAAGGKVSATVSGRTTFVVTGVLTKNTSETLRLAEQRGIRVIDEATLLALIAGKP
jgi:DNA ligase (NAD+)